MPLELPLDNDDDEIPPSFFFLLLLLLLPKNFVLTAGTRNDDEALIEWLYYKRAKKLSFS